MSHSLIEGSGGSGPDWNADLYGIDDGDNVDSDPLFVAPKPASNAPMTIGDYRLEFGSPAIDTVAISFMTHQRPPIYRTLRLI